MDIEKAKQDLKYIIDPFRIDGTTLKYSNAVRFILSELEKKDIQIIKIREFLEREQLELHDYDNNYDLSCEGKGRMYLVDELLEEYFTNKAENVGE